MKKCFFALLLPLALMVAGAAEAGQTSQTGHIRNLVARSDGLMLELDNGVPTLCSGTVGRWMIIAESNKSMLAVALMNSDNDKLVEVYTQGEFLNGICKVSMLYLQGD